PKFPRSVSCRTWSFRRDAPSRNDTTAGVRTELGELSPELLVFEVTGQRYGLPAADVRELLPAATLTALPRAPAVVEGVISACAGRRGGNGARPAMSPRCRSLQVVVRSVARQAGLAVNDRRESVEAGIRRAMARAGVTDPAAYLGVLAGDQDALDDLLAELTI